MTQQSENGFSLIELLAVIVIISALAVFSLPRLALIQIKSPVADLTEAINIARTIALYSLKKHESICLIINDNFISIRKNDIDISSLGIQYPRKLNDSVQVDPSVLKIVFNTLGETQETELSLTIGDKNTKLLIHKTGVFE